ncbi:MAG TPA: biosynthetic-type acetolactate synthase large subunit [Acidimicrobiia bacterium]|nr:biosynthetic-type acetolactate synthase large subunit [Acidimicrobiia bacterium]
MPEQLTGAQALIRSLEHEGVEIIFGMPGGAILQAYDPIIESPIRHVLARHEQGAGHMASGYAHATGRVGVAMVTSGPAATNLLTALQDAYMDSVPMVAITGQVATTSIGNDAFQEAHTWGMSMPATKHNTLITSAEEIPDAVREAFHIASTGRKGPVLIDVPKDVLADTMTWHRPGKVTLPGYRPAVKGHPRQVTAALDLIERSERPVLYIGGGVVAADATGELRAFAERINAPMVTTLMARGAFPDSHPLNLGMPGMHGNYTATTALQHSDLLITIGARFDDRITGDPKHFAREAKVIHIDVDPAEIGKIRFADVPIVGDAKAVLGQLLEEVHGRGPTPARQSWFETIESWQTNYPLAYEQDPDGPIQQQYVIEELHRITGGDATIVAGVGQHQMWVSQYWGFEEPRKWINSGGLGTMGYAIPAAIGAKVGTPDELVIAIDGDGCFQMTGTEMITAAVEHIPIKVALMNNESLGMVKQWQHLFYDGRLSQTELSPHTPDFVKFAEACGGVGLRADHPSEVAGVIEEALRINDRPVLIEFRCDPEAMLFPMVPSGGSNDDIAMSREDFMSVEDPA